MNEILIYGDIGFEVQAKDIVGQLNDMDGPVDVRVDSYGGDVYAGISILNALRRYPDEVVVYVDGMAASAASFIAVGGADKLVMSPNSSLLIHGAWSQGMGNSEEMAQLSADLNQITDNLATIYAEKTGKESSYWRDLMKKDTTFTAEQAVEAGLADMVAEFEKSVKASKRHAVMASHKSRFTNNFGGVPEIESRASAPPPPLARRSESAGNKLKEGDTVGIFDELAAKYGKSPEDVEKAFAGFFNESVQISGEVEVTYPNDVKIVPTEKIKVEPVIGDKPAEDAEGAEPVAAELVDAEAAGDSAAVQLAKQAGLTFAMGDVAEGFTAEVDEGGVVTITAPSGAEVGATVDFTVLVNETPVALGVKVRSLSEEPEEEQESGSESVDPVPAPPVDPALENKITVDVDTWNELQARAKFGDEAYVKAQSDAREKKVDEWIRDGRISAGLRGKAIAAIHRDEEAAVALYGSNPKNTVPRGEVGYGRQSGEGVDPDAAARRAKPNPFPKPKF